MDHARGGHLDRAAAPALLLVRRSPESMGLLPDGDTPERPGRPRAGSGVERANDFAFRDAVRTRAFWLLMFAGSSHSFIATALTFHHVSFMGSKRLDATIAASVFTVMAPSSLAGTLVVGYLADRMPGRHLLAFSQVVLAGAVLWSFTVSAPWQALVYGGLLGISGGFGLTLQSIIWPNYFGRKSLGSIRGAATTSMVASAAIGPLPFAWLQTLGGDYALAVLAFLALPALCAVAALLAVPPRAPAPVAANP